MNCSQIPILLRKLQGYVEQGDRIKLDGKVIAGGVGLTSGLHGEILNEQYTKAAAKWPNVEKKIKAADWTKVEIFFYRPNGRCVGRWISSGSWTLED